MVSGQNATAVMPITKTPKTKMSMPEMLSEKNTNAKIRMDIMTIYSMPMVTRPIKSKRHSQKCQYPIKIKLMLI